MKFLINTKWVVFVAVLFGATCAPSWAADVPAGDKGDPDTAPVVPPVAPDDARPSKSFDYRPGDISAAVDALYFWKSYLSLRTEEKVRSDSAYVQDVFRQLAEKRRQRLEAEKAAEKETAKAAEKTAVETPKTP